jgi:hypothetical protein
MANYTNAYAFYERIWTPIEPRSSYIRFKAQYLPKRAFLPQFHDIVMLKKALKSVAKRILWECIPFITKNSSFDVEINFNHEFTVESAQVTQVVCKLF